MVPDALERLVDLCVYELYADPCLLLVDASDVHESVQAQVKDARFPVCLQRAQILGSQTRGFLHDLARGPSLQGERVPPGALSPSPQAQHQIIRTLVLPQKRDPRTSHLQSKLPESIDMVGMHQRSPTRQLPEPKLQPATAPCSSQASKPPAKPLIPGGPCENPFCGVVEAPQWRRIERKLVCNRCGMYYHRHAHFPDWNYFNSLANKQALRQVMVMQRSHLPDSPALTAPSASPCAATLLPSATGLPVSVVPRPEQPPLPQPKHRLQAVKPPNAIDARCTATPPSTDTVMAETPQLRELQQLSSSRPATAAATAPTSGSQVTCLGRRATTAEDVAFGAALTSSLVLGNQMDAEALLHALQAQAQSLPGPLLAGLQPHMERLHLQLLRGKLKLQKGQQQQQHRHAERQMQQGVPQPAPENPDSDSTCTPWAEQEGAGSGTACTGTTSAASGAPTPVIPVRGKTQNQTQDKEEPFTGCKGDTCRPSRAVESQGSSDHNVDQGRHSGGGSHDGAAASFRRHTIASVVTAGIATQARLVQQQHRPAVLDQFTSRQTGLLFRAAAAAAVVGRHRQSVSNDERADGCAPTAPVVADATMDGQELPVPKRRRAALALDVESTFADFAKMSVPDQRLLFMQPMLSQPLSEQQQEQSKQVLLQCQQQTQAARRSSSSPQMQLQQQHQQMRFPQDASLSPLLAAVLQEDKSMSMRAVHQAVKTPKKLQGHSHVQDALQLAAAMVAGQQHEQQHLKHEMKRGQERETESLVAGFSRSGMGASLIDTIAAAAALQHQQQLQILQREPGNGVEPLRKAIDPQQTLLRQQHHRSSETIYSANELAFRDASSASTVSGQVMRDLQQRAQQQQQTANRKQQRIVLHSQGRGASTADTGTIADLVFNGQLRTAAATTEADMAILSAGGVYDAPHTLQHKLVSGVVVARCGGAAQQALHGVAVVGPISARSDPSIGMGSIVDMLLARGLPNAPTATPLEAALNSSFICGGGAAAAGFGGVRHGSGPSAGMVLLPVLDLGKPSAAVAF